MNGHAEMLDDVAVYALGTLPADQAARVRAHIATCEECRAEYEALRPAVAAVGTTVEACHDQVHGAVYASPLLKARIMREVRKEQANDRAVKPAPAPVRGRMPMWPAYLVAAACLAIALVSTLFNLSLTQQLHSTQAQLAENRQRASGLTQTVAEERIALADLMDQNAKHYAVHDGEVVAAHDRLYLTMHGLPALPAGHVYQAWTLPKGSKTMVPSRTFVPDAHGAAIVPVGTNAAGTAAVAVSVEPEGGSKAPTTKPVALTTLN